MCMKYLCRLSVVGALIVFTLVILLIFNVLVDNQWKAYYPGVHPYPQVRIVKHRREIFNLDEINADDSIDDLEELWEPRYGDQSLEQQNMTKDHGQDDVKKKEELTGHKNTHVEDGSKVADKKNKRTSNKTEHLTDSKGTLAKGETAVTKGTEPGHKDTKRDKKKTQPKHKHVHKDAGKIEKNETDSKSNKTLGREQAKVSHAENITDIIDRVAEHENATKGSIKTTIVVKNEENGHDKDNGTQIPGGINTFATARVSQGNSSKTGATTNTHGANESAGQSLNSTEDEEFYKKKRVKMEDIPGPYRQKRPEKAYRNLLHVKPPSFLPNFKNPCWVEELPSAKPYGGLVFYNETPIFEAFQQMEELWGVSMASNAPWRLRCLPYFFVAGMPKCGTTDLFEKLTLHPNISQVPIKEPHFWTRWREGWERGVGFVPISNYIDMYDQAAETIRTDVIEDREHHGANGYHPKIFGDGSVTTLYENDWSWRLTENRERPFPENRIRVPQYLHHVLPAARTVVMVRNPTDRLYSDYIFFDWTRNKSISEFHRLVVKGVALMRACLMHRPLYECAMDTLLYKGMDVKIRLREGMYATFLQQWLKVYPRDQLLVIRLEDFSVNRTEYMLKAWSFLGVGPVSEELALSMAELETANARPEEWQHLGPMWKMTRAILNNFYHSFNLHLAELLQDERFLWKEAQE